ncbi:MAG TPA: hypothetical protein VHB79_35940 [Polyangiaceae bacterium]|nr:hypothetical protein [Polyangiaceae bacterium]
MSKHVNANKRGAANRQSLEELCARYAYLTSALAGALRHDVNNLLASLQTNAFLLRGAVAGEDADTLCALESAIDAGKAIPRALGVFELEPPPEPGPPIKVSDAMLMVKPLLRQLGRSDVSCVVGVAAEVRHLEANNALIRQGFLTLVVLAAELLPDGAELAIAAAPRPPSGVRLTLGLSAIEIPKFLSRGGALREAPEQLPLTELVRRFARIHGGDLLVTTSRSGGLELDLSMPEAAPN